jgi:hypothetical protein
MADASAIFAPEHRKVGQPTLSKKFQSGETQNANFMN